MILVDLNNRVVVGYCTKKNFQEQMQLLKQACE